MTCSDAAAAAAAAAGAAAAWQLVQLNTANVQTDFPCADFAAALQ